MDILCILFELHQEVYARSLQSRIVILSLALMLVSYAQSQDSEKHDDRKKNGEDEGEGTCETVIILGGRLYMLIVWSMESPSQQGKAYHIYMIKIKYALLDIKLKN